VEGGIEKGDCVCLAGRKELLIGGPRPKMKFDFFFQTDVNLFCSEDDLPEL
jgi:hypothetical protein